MLRIICETVQLNRIADLVYHGEWTNGTCIGIAFGQFFLGLVWRHDRLEAKEGSPDA